MLHTEVKYLMDTWDLTQSQSEKLHNGFQQNTIDANTLCQILNEDNTDFITLDVAQDAIKFKGMNPSQGVDSDHAAKAVDSDHA